MSLTPSDVVWYNPTYDKGSIIDNCGELNNVPLLGIRGGISYNPVLARRQFKYPMEERPRNIHLENVYYHNQNDVRGMREQVVRAWNTIRRRDKGQLGRKTCTVHETYTQWVNDRATQFGMPYKLPRFLSAITPAPPMPVTFDTEKEYQKQITELTHESATWKRRYDETMLQIETMSGQLEQKDCEILKQRRQMIERDELLLVKDRLLDRYANKKKRMDFFFGAHSNSDDPLA